MPRLTDSRHGSVTNHLKRLPKILRGMAWKTLSELSITAWISEEPRPFRQRRRGEAVNLVIGDSWGNLFDCAWMQMQGRVPSAKLLADQHLVALIDIGGEALVCDSRGAAIRAITNRASEFWRPLGEPLKRVVDLRGRAATGKTCTLWLDAAMNDLFGAVQDGGRVAEAHLAIQHDEARALLYDVVVLMDLLTVLPESRARWAKVHHALWQVAALIGDGSNDQVVDEAREILAPHLAKRGGDRDLHLTAVGHAHLDLAWLWPVRETRRKNVRTLATADELMRQYSDYHLTVSQPQLLDWLQQDNPLVYQRVISRMNEGRMEPVGAMWVEPDANMPSGESLLRQIIYGQEAWSRHVDCKRDEIWLPDTFGYPASLPSIFAHAGISSFITQKLSWNTTNQHPHHSFIWQGINGATVDAHLLPEETYSSAGLPHSAATCEKNHLDSDVCDHALMVFGIGDGGAGPGAEHLEALRRQTDLAGVPTITQRSLTDFWQDWRQQRNQLCRWQGELYLERHQGTLTTHGWIKTANRRLEEALARCELAQVIAGQYHADFQPVAIDHLWREVLLYQFHDILPGSSIKRVYDDCLPRMTELLDQIDAVTNNAEEYWSTLHLAGDYLITSSSHVGRQEWIKIGSQWYQPEVPACGYAFISKDDATDATTPTVIATDNGALVIDNDIVRLALGTNGSFVSLDYQGFNYLADGGNYFSVYADTGDAWDFPIHYRSSPAQLMQLAQRRVEHDGPMVRVIQRFVYENSWLEQVIEIVDGSAHINLRLQGDWRSVKRMLRWSATTSIIAHELCCDIQFGVCKRPLHANTSWDSVRQEVAAHHWVDHHDGQRGLALLNDSRYGHAVAQQELDIALLRSVPYPGSATPPDADDETACTDIGPFGCNLALLPHLGDYQRAQVDAAGLAVNQPLRVRQLKPRQRPAPGSIPARMSWLDTGSPHVAISAIKPAQDGDGIIIRVYETSGTACSTTLQCAWPLTQVQDVDGCEQPRSPWRNVPADQAIPLQLAPFAIHSLRLRP